MSENKSKLEFIPFNAINEFMRSDYRMNLLKDTMASLPNLSTQTQATINRLTKKHVKVPGFRNSTKAPATVKAVSMVKPFEQQPKFAAVILKGWVESHTELSKQVFDLLNGFEWKLLPLEVDRSKIPGFLTQWPEEDDYEKIYAAFNEANPDCDNGIDDVSLMVVWLSLRLPVEKVSKADIVNLPVDFEKKNQENES